MDILVIYLSPFNGLSSSAKRMLGMTKGLVKNGNNVVLLTAGINNECNILDSAEYDFLKKVKIILTEEIDGGKGETIQNTKWKGKIFECLGKVYRLVKIYGHTEKVAKKISINILPIRKFDCVVSVSDPKTSHIALKKLLEQGLRVGKIIEYWGDPLFGDITLKSIYSKRTLLKREKAMLGLADSIVYTSPFTVEREKVIFPEYASRMYFVPTASVSENVVVDKNRENAVYTIGYYGAYHSAARNILPLYNAFLSEKTNKMHLNIIGDTDLNLESQNNVTILPRGDIREYEAKSDLLVCILNREGTQIPGKLYYCATTYKPVLVIVDGDEKEKMRRFLEGFERFFLCENDTNDIAKKIQEISEDKREWNPAEILQEENVARKIIEG